MKAQERAKIVSWIRKEEKWGIILVEIETKKYVKEENGVVDAIDTFEAFVGGQAFQKALDWGKGTEREIDIDIHSDPFDNGKGVKHYAKISIWGIKSATAKPSFNDIKNGSPDPAVPANDDDDLPF